jgi:hypothetical protein
MKKCIIAIQIITVCLFTSQCTQTDSRYDQADQLDDQLVEKAQKTLAHIENTAIEVQALEKSPFEFGSSYAGINVEENWVQPVYTFVPEALDPSTEAPASINGVIVAKFKSKDRIDTDFDLSNDEPQGICADVQQDIYEDVLALLTEKEKVKYESEGKSLSFIPDDDPPPYDNSTNPVTPTGFWLDRDPAEMVTRDDQGNYYFETLSHYSEFNDPDLQHIDEKFRGVRYCKFLSHQVILNWMLDKSFKQDPVLLTATIPECTQPSSLETTSGSCIFYFTQARTYYCSDYTGRGFTPESAQEKCLSRPSSDEYTATYLPVPCSERTDELEAIPGYMGQTGHCVIHCQEDNEFIWNIYTEDPEGSCAGYDLFTPEEIAELGAGE